MIKKNLYLSKLKLRKFSQGVSKPFFLIGIVIASFLFLTSCATMPATSSGATHKLPWSVRKHQLATITQWQLTGATAIKLPQHGLTASIVWQQKGDDYHIQLFGPFGIGRTIINQHNGIVTLSTNGQLYTAKSPEALMQNTLGWQLPVSNLFYWIRGLPSPGLYQHIEFDHYHHLRKLNQQGWTINYQRYTSVNGVDIPSLLTLSQQDISVKLIISRWQFQ